MLSDNLHTQYSAVPNTETKPILPQELVLYPKRWFILAVFCMLTLSNCLMWITFAPISQSAADYYHVSSTSINSLSLVYMIVYIPLIFPSSWIIDQKGLAVGMQIGAFLNCLGGWIRYTSTNFYVVFLGQFLASVAQTFTLSAPVKLAANWFGPQERTTATSIGAIFNQLGIAIGFYMSPAIAVTPQHIPLLILVQAIFGSAVWLLVVVFFRKSTPPTPPSYAAASEKTEFFKGITGLLREPSFLVLLLSFGIALGIFYAVCTVLTQMLTPLGYSENESGIFGVVIVLVGLAGAFLMGIVVDKTKKYKILACLSIGGVMVAMLMLTFSLKRNHYAMLYGWASIFGFFATAIIPGCLEAGVETTYPIAEGLSSGMLLMSAQAFGTAITLVMSTLQEKYSPHVACYAALGCGVAAFGISLFFKCKDKRIQLEAAGGK